MSNLTLFIATKMLNSPHRYECVKAAMICHTLADRHLTDPSAYAAKLCTEAYDKLLGKCLLFSSPISVNGDTVDLRELANILDPRN